MILYAQDDTALMEIQAVERSGPDLLIKGKVFGTMPITARLTPQQARQGLKLMSLRTVLFLLTLPFRRKRRG